jgi:hypothetical protein
MSLKIKETQHTYFTTGLLSIVIQFKLSGRHNLQHRFVFRGRKRNAFKPLMTAQFPAQMSNHFAALLHIPIAKPQKDEDASLIDCYAVSSGATVTKVSKNHTAFILTVR